MHELFRKKLLSLRSGLLAAYHDSKAFPSAVSGREREVFLDALLKSVLPPHFRVGSGVITDHRSSTTGQIDLVVELPLSLSFQVVGESRLYFADTVGATIEVKSNLSTQWDECLEKQREVNSLTSKQIDETQDMHILSDYKVPFFIVAYRGPRSMRSIEKRIQPRMNYPPAGIYVIESNLFVGYFPSTWTYSETEAGALAAFIMSLYTALSARQHRQVDFRSYTSSPNKRQV